MKSTTVPNRAAALARLFIGVYPAGIVYADKKRERDGDYLRLAFLPYSTLALEWTRDVDIAGELRSIIEEDARTYKAGELCTVSSCGQTVLLGDSAKSGAS